MKKELLLVTLFFCVCFSFAQQQQGYVKTKGRLGSNGAVIKGTRLSGAMVTVKGRNAVLSGSNGTFTLAIPGNNFYLQNVQKQGYVLTDPDILEKQYAYSKNPLVIVLETQEQQTDDRLQAERKIRRTLQYQLQKREDEIESLKEQNKLTREEFHKQLEALYAEQEGNERLIGTMAERYSRIDYDQIDAFNRQVSEYILNGELHRADSLLNSKGNIAAQISEQLNKGLALKEQKSQLKKAEALYLVETEELGRRCYNKYEIFKMQYQNDSAAYYIKLRADLDTLNIDWQTDAGIMYEIYMAQFSQAEYYFKRALRQSVLQEGESRKTAVCYRNLGDNYDELGLYDQALECHQKALEVMLKVYDESYYEVGNTYYSLGLVYNRKGEYQKALDYAKKALSILEASEETPPIDMADAYNMTGSVYTELADYDNAEQYLLKAKEMMDHLLGEDNDKTVNIYTNLGRIYKIRHDYTNAMAYYQKSLDVYKKIYGEYHKATAQVFSNMGSAMLEKGDYPLAITYLEKSLAITQQLLGPEHLMNAGIYVNLAGCYAYQGDIAKGLDYYWKAHDIFLPLIGPEHPYMASVYMGIGSLLDEQGHYEQAIEYLEKARDLFVKTIGEDYPYKAGLEKGIEDVKAKMNKK